MKIETCLLCNSVGIQEKIIEVPDVYLEKTYAVYRCPACGVGRVVDLPKIRSDLYGDGTYQQSEKRTLARFLKRCLHRIEINKLLRSGAAQSFIDVGCGSGDLACYLFESGFPIIAADSAAHRPGDLQNFPQIEYLHFNYETLTTEKPELIRGKTVILRHVLEHISDPKKFIQQFIDGGASFFYIVVPNSAGLSKRVFGKYESIWGLPYHVWHFDKRSLIRFCESAGLNVIKSGHETIPSFLYSLGRYLEAKKAPLFLQKLFRPSIHKVIIFFPFDIFSFRNVVYVHCRVPTADPKS